jgi:hypothetical protein
MSTCIQHISGECMVLFTLAWSRAASLVVTRALLSALGGLFFSSRGFGQSATRKNILEKKTHTFFESGFLIVDLVTRLVSGGSIAFA